MQKELFPKERFKDAAAEKKRAPPFDWLLKHTPPPYARKFVYSPFLRRCAYASRIARVRPRGVSPIPREVNIEIFFRNRGIIR